MQNSPFSVPLLSLGVLVLLAALAWVVLKHRQRKLPVVDARYAEAFISIVAVFAIAGLISNLSPDMASAWDVSTTVGLVALAVWLLWRVTEYGIVVADSFDKYGSIGKLGHSIGLILSVAIAAWPVQLVVSTFPGILSKFPSMEPISLTYGIVLAGAIIGTGAVLFSRSQQNLKKLQRDTRRHRRRPTAGTDR